MKIRSKVGSVVLVLGGIVIGCAAAAVAPTATSWAQPQGKWGCFVVDRFPDVQAAHSWEGATNITQGLNQVAAHVPSGATLSLTPKSGGYPSVACIKY